MMFRTFFYLSIVPFFCFPANKKTETAVYIKFMCYLCGQVDVFLNNKKVS